MKPIECTGVEEQNITFAYISARLGNSLFDVRSTDISAWFLVGNINAGSITIEQIERHCLNRGGFRARIKVAQGIDVSRAMIAHQKTSGLVGEASLKVLYRLFVCMMFPNDSF